MEDISRKLEREIAKSKPKPFKKNRKIKILIVDDFGKVISGNHIKPLFLALSFIFIITFLASIWLFYQYTFLSREADATKKSLTLAEKKVSELTDEKEVLMARLVILGKDPGVKKSGGSNSAGLKSATTDPLDNPGEEKVNSSIGSEKEKTTGIPVVGSTTQAMTGPAPETTQIKAANQIITIENFSVIRNKAGKDLSVRFDIRNISKDQSDVSGRIFTILKPDNDIEDQWLVVPAVGLKNGAPLENQKGQYFSISRFKPVHFKIKSEVSPDFYKKAAIFIYSSEGDLIFEKLIDIADAE